MSSSGYKYREDEINIEGEGREDVYKGAPPAGLGPGENNHGQCLDAQQACSSARQRHTRGRASSHLGTGRRCCKNGQVVWGGQGPREDGGRWALAHAGPSVRSVDDIHAVCELRRLPGGESRSSILGAKTMSSPSVQAPELLMTLQLLFFFFFFPTQYEQAGSFLP